MTRFESLRPTLILIVALAVPTVLVAANNTGAADVDQSWLAEAQQNIIDMEYQLSWSAHPADDGTACFQAPNRSQGLRFYFRDDSTIGAQAREQETGDAWQTSVQLTELRRADERMSLLEAPPEVEEDTATYRRGALRHSVSNEKTGLIHRMVIDSSPDGDAALRIHFEVHGATLHRQGASAVEFRSAGQPVIRFRGVEATDALGQVLPVNLEVLANGTGFELVVDDEGTTYPIQVKAAQGLPSAASWYALGAADGEEYGFSVATAGDVNGDGYSDIVIGAPSVDSGATNTGAAYLFLGSSTGPATSHSWSVTGGTAWGNLGYAVATAGDVNGDGYGDLAIGEPGYIDQSGDAIGAVRVFYGSSTGLSSSAEWFRDDPHDQVNGGFGSAVASAGDVDGDGYSDLLIGQPYYDGAYTDDGWVGLYFGGSSGLEFGSSWTQLGSGGDRMGFAVATAGDLNGDGYSDFVIGAPYDNNATYTEQGTAVVFLGSSSGPQFPGLYIMGNQDGAHLGSSVAPAGDVNGDGYADLLVGVPDYDTLMGDEGVAYIYYGSSTFDTTSDWFAFGEQQDAHFGTSVAGAGDVNGDGYGDFVIGEPVYNGTVTAEGRALVWYGGASGPALGTPANANWSSTSGVVNTRFGASVAAAGDVNGDGYSDILVGAPDYSYSYSLEGAAFLYFGGPNNLDWNPRWTYESNWADANLGFSVAAAGDVNGDGYADIIVGAPYYDSSFSNEGAALLFLGSSTGPNSVSDWFARGNQEGALFGWAVNTAGDVNGDGYSDVIIGAPSYDYSAVDSGAIFVWFGSAGGMGGDGTPGNEDWFGISAYGGGQLGYSASSAGDVNGDGYADVAGGAPNWSNGQTNEGAVFVWHGSATGLGADGDPSNADWQDEGDTENLILGTSLAAAGDVNGDGYSDLIAGGLNIAAAWHGSATGLRASGVDWATAQADVAYLFGRSIAGCGDINGDGYSDVVVGAPTYSQYYTGEGAAWAYCGSSTGLNSSSCWWDTGYRENAYFGMSVAGAGDLNGDGYSDIAAGAPGWSNPQSNEGQVRVYYGSSLGPVSFNDGDWTSESNYDGATLGASVAGVGDVNGDGYGDLVGGSSGFANGQTDEGRLSFYYGNGGPGVTVLPRQLASDGISPIAPLGLADSETEVGLSMRARTSSGRSRVGFYVEIKPQGVPFDGMNLQWVSGTADTGISGVVMNKAISTLTKATRYHWRTRLGIETYVTPFEPPNSRWYYLQSGGFAEEDLRTAGTQTSPSGLIFKDGFEGGNFNNWSAHN